VKKYFFAPTPGSGRKLPEQAIDFGRLLPGKFSKNHEFSRPQRPKTRKFLAQWCSPSGFSEESQEILFGSKSPTLQNHRTSFILLDSFPAVKAAADCTARHSHHRPAQQVRQL
jgi:hypothetical protein